MRDHAGYINRFNSVVRRQETREQVNEAIAEASHEGGGGSAEAERWKVNLLKQARTQGEDENGS